MNFFLLFEYDSNLDYTESIVCSDIPITYDFITQKITRPKCN